MISMPIEVNGEVFLNTSEAMGRLGVSRPTFDQLVKEGRLPRYRQGIRKLPYYKQSDIEKLLGFEPYTEEEE